MIDYTRAELVKYDMSTPENEVTLRIGDEVITMGRRAMFLEFTALCDVVRRDPSPSPSDILQIKAGRDFFERLYKAQIAKLYKGQPDPEINGEQIGLHDE